MRNAGLIHCLGMLQNESLAMVVATALKHGVPMGGGVVQNM